MQNFAMIAVAYRISEDRDELHYGFETWGINIFVAGNVLVAAAFGALFRLMKPEVGTAMSGARAGARSEATSL